MTVSSFRAARDLVAASVPAHVEVRPHGWESTEEFILAAGDFALDGGVAAYRVQKASGEVRVEAWIPPLLGLDGMTPVTLD